MTRQDKIEKSLSMTRRLVAGGWTFNEAIGYVALEFGLTDQEVADVRHDWNKGE